MALPYSQIDRLTNNSFIGINQFINPNPYFYRTQKN